MCIRDRSEVSSSAPVSETPKSEETSSAPVSEASNSEVISETSASETPKSEASSSTPVSEPSNSEVASETSVSETPKSEAGSSTPVSEASNSEVCLLYTSYFFSESDLRVPFRNMIYLGDSDTDIPCMKLVKTRGGYSIGVFNPETNDRTCLLYTSRCV